MNPQQDDESEILRGLFDEVMKMIHQKQIPLETIVQRSIEQGDMTADSFKRISDMLADYGAKKQWKFPP